MRVIAGIAKGRRLKGPPARVRGSAQVQARPTSDLLRGVIFSMLDSMGADISRVLDVYAGSGALGIEALSRGAEQCDFVERDGALCGVISENVRTTGFEQRSSVLCLPVERAVGRLQGVYDLILADPPYADQAARETIKDLAGSSLIRSGHTVLVLEHAAAEEPAGNLSAMSLVKVRRHGDSAVSIYR